MTDHTVEADPVDLHVGARVRAVRKLRGISQEALASAAGVSFQQIQKYEKGYNRISASMLTRIAEALESPVSDFFPSKFLGNQTEHAIVQQAYKLAGRDRGEQLIEQLVQLPEWSFKLIVSIVSQIQAADRSS